jgi:hypothetical protein
MAMFYKQITIPDFTLSSRYFITHHQNETNFSMLFLPLTEKYRNENGIYFTRLLNAVFETCYLNGDSITPITELGVCTCFISDFRKLKGQDVGMASSSAKVTQSFG